MQVEMVPSGARLLKGASKPMRFSSPCGASDEVLYRRPCPFLNHPHATRIPGYPGWCTIPPTASQYKDHCLIVPEACWRREEVRRLGGRANIATALDIARTLAATADFFVAANVGIHGAQTEAHAHWHFMRDPGLRRRVVVSVKLKRVYAKPNRLVFNADAIAAFAGGTSPGQCIIVPRDVSSRNAHQMLPGAIERLVALGAEKFKSEEGLSPDYSVYLGFVRGRFHAGCYTPRLNFLGAVEYASSALWKHQSIGMSWTHDEIALFLRQA